jgi:5-methyltetrahydropteroyltriglutamate--homocysteine methyltransferase
LGFPRIGAARELKKAVEAFWSAKIGEAELVKQAAALRAGNWRVQYQNGLAHIPSNDFSFYDQVLDTATLVGAVPERYGRLGGLADYFAVARGRQQTSADGALLDVAAMEMTKWFDTNYHYIVPELRRGQSFRLTGSKPLDDFNEALALGIKTRPVLIGPFTFLKLGKTGDAGFDALSLLPSLVEVYKQIVEKLASAGAEWIQMDEPFLAMDISSADVQACRHAYAAIKEAAGSTKILLTSYFEGYHENLTAVCGFPVDGVHIDLVRAPGELDRALASLPPVTFLSLGVVDGRNIWKNDFSRSLSLLEKAKSNIGKDRMLIAPSCSLLHTPVDLNLESKLNPELKRWMAFAKQKIQEVVILTEAVNNGRGSIDQDLAENASALRARSISAAVHDAAVKQRVAALAPEAARRSSGFTARRQKQQARWNLPLLPTTTIGSFPQTADIRAARRAFKAGALTEAAYKERMRAEIKAVVDKQTEIGLDVFVHGEPERNDMVEYFGELLSGFAFTENGWVQSYGSRGVKPPVIFGDVARPNPMSVEWSAYAQSLTAKPMKGMLTGPITILQWSFVRDDQSRRDTARQIALAIRDEVQDLEKAGIGIIQIDEAAIREGLPLRRADRAAYFKWSVECFLIASGGVRDETQIHTHMCYSEFNDMIEPIAAMDADVITIEASRSGMELLAALKRHNYPNDIGPGVYDIHSPRVPSIAELVTRLEAILEVVPVERVWVNPDCGLKTRGWPEVEASLKNMVAAA